jgi:hypothetical protein
MGVLMVTPILKFIKQLEALIGKEHTIATIEVIITYKDGQIINSGMRLGRVVTDDHSN